MNCLNDIQNFMFANKLKLNPDKTEFILIGSRKNRNQLLPHFPINILGNQVSPEQSVRNLGVVFESNFTFSNHISQVIKSTRVQARDLYRIRPLLDLNTISAVSEALGWFKSYLSGRTHSVKVGSTLSHPAALHYGVPQGSVLGPILFSLYTNTIGSIIHSHSSINYHFYPDDTQLYITLSPENFSLSKN